MLRLHASLDSPAVSAGNSQALPRNTAPGHCRGPLRKPWAKFSTSTARSARDDDPVLLRRGMGAANRRFLPNEQNARNTRSCASGWRSAVRAAKPAPKRFGFPTKDDGGCWPAQTLAMRSFAARARACAVQCCRCSSAVRIQRCISGYSAPSGR